MTSGCEYCDSENGEHPNWDRIVLIDGKPFCIYSRARLTNGDGELEEQGDRELTEKEIDALFEEKIEPVAKNKKDLPLYPWNPKSWRIVTLAPVSAMHLGLKAE